MVEPAGAVVVGAAVLVVDGSVGGVALRAPGAPDGRANPDGATVVVGPEDAAELAGVAPVVVGVEPVTALDGADPGTDEPGTELDVSSVPAMHW